MNFDRRRSLRLPVDLTAQWRRGWRHIMAKVHDISTHGLFVMTDELAEANHILDLVVALPTGPVSFTAVARFCGKSKFGHGIGCEIHVIAPADQAAWLAYYRQRHSQAMRALPESVVNLLNR